MKVSLLGLILILIVGTAVPSRAAEVDVGVGLFSLSPNPVNINAGDSVYWFDADEDFSPYIISGAWGAFYTPGGVQFTGTGTYQYTAQSIFGGNWGGTVNVSAGSNSLPVVTITNPTNNSVFTAPATFAFEADASDLDLDDVWDVEFWVEDERVDDDYSAPYATTVTNLAAGVYTLKAIVWDYSYATATNTISITVVDSGPITLTGTVLVNGNLVFNATGLAVGKTNVLQYSTNLVSQSGWVPVSTNVATSSTTSFTNAVASGRRFFRLVQFP